MKPIFCGNFEYDAREGDLERLFRKYGKVERVDMKSGFAFIYMEDERDADDAIRALDRIEFGRRGRRLRVEWTKNDRGGGGGGRRSEGSRRSSSMRPSKTLFVINFDAQNTRTRDLERHFEPYGKIVNVRIRRNFAFVQYDSLEDATRALDATNMSKLLDRVISVEYAVKDDDVRGNGHSPDKHRDRSPDRRRRSVSPYRRERGSPDYGRGPSPGPYRKERGSPDYSRRRSPSPLKREKASPDYGRRERDENLYRRERAASPEIGEINHSRSRSRNRSHSPHKREKQSPNNGYARDRSPYAGEEGSPRNERGDSLSPYKRERSTSPANGRGPSPGSMPESPAVRERYNNSRSPPAEE